MPGISVRSSVLLPADEVLLAHSVDVLKSSHAAGDFDNCTVMVLLPSPSPLQAGAEQCGASMRSNAEQAYGSNVLHPRHAERENDHRSATVHRTVHTLDAAIGRSCVSVCMHLSII